MAEPIVVPGLWSGSTVAAAARAFGNGRSSALRQRMTGIEKAADFTVIDCTSRPLAPTKRGLEFLHEAAGILASPVQRGGAG